MKKLATLFSLLFISHALLAQSHYIVDCKKQDCVNKYVLWEFANDTKFTTRLYEYPARATSSEKTPAVIICPGGSYHHLGIDNEGHRVARWFAEQGIAAYVLRYRVSSHGAHHPDMIQDLQLSIAFLKTFADQFNIDTAKIGAIGFSAGGHLVLHGGIARKNFIEKEYPASSTMGLRPNYVMAIYPVVSMEDSIAHKRSRKNLLTRNYTTDDIHTYSIEQNIPVDMPPTFVLAAHDDDVVDFRNSQYLWRSLDEKHIQNALFVPCTSGGHGFGMYRTKSVETKDWNKKHLKGWLQDISILPRN